MIFFQNIHKTLSGLTPYLLLSCLALLLVNYTTTQKIKKQVVEISNDISDLNNSINSISLEYDNSDVIDNIEFATYRIIDEINSAESSLKTTIMIWN